MNAMEMTGKYGKDCKIFADEVEATAIDTIQDILDDEVSADVPVRIMPDVHAGVDIVIGFTMPLADRVNPNHIGVDIGCGVLCVRMPKLDVPLSEIDRLIRKTVPMGFAHRETVCFNLPSDVENDVVCLAEALGQDLDRVKRQIGTLGGGNHFIEIGESGDNWYLFVHSGSRNFGLQVCNYHVTKAKAKGSKYLFGEDMREYLEDMAVAQWFASTNRSEIAGHILTALGTIVGHNVLSSNSTVCDTIHNYIDFDRKIIRKGAVRAEDGELLVIPMNMRDGVLLCRGKGNPDWNYSAPHGAGRILARGEAKRRLDMAEFEREMSGVFSTSVCRETIDESPMAYKPMNTIIKQIGETVEIVDTIRPILNVKAKE